MVQGLQNQVQALSLRHVPARRTKLIVGIDYGTTFTGVAFVHENATDPKEIKTFTDWPGALRENNEHNEKTPSVISYASENPEQEGQDAWGYEVEPGSKSYAWTKLLLDARSQAARYDDPTLRTHMGRGLLQLPPGKKAVQVVGDYLKKVHDHLIDAIIEKCGGSDILDVTPIEYWLTVPAIWSDKAKAATREAALYAGFGSRRIDEINLIPEPEAAAMLALKTSVSETDSLVKPNTGVLVCDCGGGTVDITSYTIARTVPTLVLNESSKGDGAKCGGTYIDRNLHKMMAERFGKAFTSLPADRTGPNSRFMVTFESRKQQFSVANTRKSYKLPLIMPELEKKSVTTPGYDKKYKDVILTEADMLQCFEPVVQGIIDLINDQVQSVKKRDEPEVKTVVLVGGLGCSKHVRDSVKKWCEEREIRMVTPWSGAWSAVARGAALHGLGAVKIEKRITRRHYGQEIAEPFVEGVDKTSGPLWDRRWKDLWSGETMINGHMQWLVAKNTVFEESTEIVSSWITHCHESGARISSNKIYSYAKDKAPNDLSAKGVVTVGNLLVNFADVDLSRFECKEDDEGEKVWRLKVKVFIKLGARQGTLAFRTTIAGQECGETTMDFSGH
ncbi:hypothetical protein A1O7_01731 [Cladophialophora yegresii CBS 114405]|uniref:Hsp70-like protein n=1 Tax=Cladophialophora yegresii CBS 114405 TaxID=1182544 RepID=W9WK81_9EURO|nr:uncharacterized protein A1O7_01731 [Cladophialophora yegresii CBS 114405]EXJ65390.1 hypothetical protein A1O7_01731 [Cladophialophora yegresii CBS 114405]